MQKQANGRTVSGVRCFGLCLKPVDFQVSKIQRDQVDERKASIANDPTESYSSSDDENFYDANDETSSLSSVKRKALADKLNDPTVDNEKLNEEAVEPKPELSVADPKRINYDESTETGLRPSLDD
jgi:hypothetical protein